MLGPGAEMNDIFVLLVSVQEFTSAQGKGVYCGRLEMVQVGTLSGQPKDLTPTRGFKGIRHTLGRYSFIGVCGF